MKVDVQDDERTFYMSNVRIRTMPSLMIEFDRRKMDVISSAANIMLNKNDWIREAATVENGSNICK